MKITALLWPVGVTITSVAAMPPADIQSQLNEFVLTITVRDGRIFAQATGQGQNEIFAKARDEFFLKVVDAQISFTRDASGRVIGLVLHQNGRDMPAKKTG